jgi:serine/threonine-protein kinase
MADIYLGRGDGGRLAAVKVMNRRRALDAEAAAMFLDETKLGMLFDHPNIVETLEVGSEAGQPYCVMELVHGVDLRAMLNAAAAASTRIPYGVAIAMLMEVAAGLEHAHRRAAPDGTPLQLVHRDVSLSNVMVGHDGTVKILDFGIASTAVQTVHTAPGIVRGKASYMAPEQCLAEAIDARADVFALGVVLYETTTGMRCFHGTSDFERMVAVVRGEYHLPSTIHADFPADLEAVIAKALARCPDGRYQSCAELANALADVMLAHGWSGDVLGWMHSLYGEVPLPYVEAPTASATSMTFQARPRFARGTNADGYEPRDTTMSRMELASDFGSSDEDDVPTRGRPRLRVSTNSIAPGGNSS